MWGHSLSDVYCCDQVRLQRPTVSAEMSFLLEVVTFFVPNLALDGAKTAPFRTHDLLLSGSLPVIAYVLSMHLHYCIITYGWRV